MFPLLQVSRLLGQTEVPIDFLFSVVTCVNMLYSNIQTLHMCGRNENKMKYLFGSSRTGGWRVGVTEDRVQGKYIGQLKSRKSSKRKEFKARTKSWSHGDSETKKTESERWSQEDIGSHTHRIEIEFLIGGSRPRLTQICTLFVSTFF